MVVAGLTAAIVLAGGSHVPATAAPENSGTMAAAQGFCQTALLDRPRRGEDAIRRLGSAIGSAAARSGTSSGELRRRLRADRTLWLDTCGMLFFADEVPTQLADPDREDDLAGMAEGPAQGDPPSTTNDGATWPLTIALSDAFALHSRPGANRVIYLDFDGQLISGTIWNSEYGIASWTAPAFSLDPDASTFTDAERAAVIEVWQRVAQDFAPFAVDVTTQDPGADAITRSGSADLRFGTRVLISPDATQSECSCAGVAYLDVFDRSSNHAYTQPAWVYPQAVSNRARHIAEAVSHETGHNLGLEHDGTQTAGYYAGSGGWGPIMGAPYNQAVTQWSNGSYPGANNTQDDLALIAGNGAPLVADDASDASAFSVPLILDGPVTGLLNTTADVDTYSVTVGDGRFTAIAEPSWPGPDVDLALTLRDAAGTVLASAAPAFDTANSVASLSASLDLEVAAGSYTLQVEGVGNGILGSAGASDYGSVGWYSVRASGTAPPTTSPTADPTDGPTAPPTDPATPAPTGSSGSSGSSTTGSSGAPTTGVPSAADPVASQDPATATGPTIGVGTARALAIDSRTLPTAKKRTRYRAALVASGGSGGYVWKRVKGKLPKGLTLSRTGTVTGRATKKGSVRFQVRATDSSGARTTAWVRIRVR